MTVLRVLGSLSLQSDDGRELRSITAQPKRLALLTYLAIASRSGSVRRDTVLGLFWPELDTARARHALRQAIYQLRRELGPEVVDGNGDDQLRISRDHLGCDACEFADALAAEERERALERYGGDLLPGLYLADCAEFEQWLESARARLAGQALAAAGELCRSAEAAGRKADAVRWARRAHELAPYDEPVLRRLLEVLEAAGDLGTAVLAYEAFASRYERELGLAPAAETAAVIARIRSRPPLRRARRRTPAAVAAAPEAAPRPTPGSPRFSALLWSVAVLVLLVAAGAVAARRLHPGASVDRNALAVLPFRLLAPTPDSLLLSEGVAELLATALQSEREPQVRDAQLTAQRWRAAVGGSHGEESAALAADVARSVGAGLALHGSAFYRGSEVVLSATLLDVVSGEVHASATVDGPAERLVPLVQQLAARTLGGLLREDPLRLERLTSTDYQAVHSYLAGRAAARRGNYDQAIPLLQRAVEIDSAFAAAALALVDVSGWAGRGIAGRYEQLAYRHRDRLGPRDTAYLRGLIGYDAYTGRGSTGDLVRATEDAAAAVPDRPEVLYLLGDRYFHDGDFVARPRAAFRSRALMERSVALDSGFNPGREHLLQLAVLTDDRAAVRRYREDLLRREPDGLRTPGLLWLAAQYLDEAAEQRRLRAALDTMNPTSLYIIVRDAQEYGFGAADAERAMRVLLAHAGTAEEVDHATGFANWLYRNLGRPAEAERFRPLPRVGPETKTGGLLRLVRAGITSDAPPATAGAAAAELARRARAPAGRDSARFERYQARYGSLCWQLWQRDTADAAARLAALRAEPAFPPGMEGWEPRSEREFRVAFLEALLERARARPAHPRPALARLDSLAREGLHATDVMLANAILPALLEEAGERERALAAARRRLRGTGNSLNWLAPMLRQEARLAAALGDRAGAMAAYRNYLALRVHPEPALRPQADSVRAEFERLLGARGQARGPATSWPPALAGLRPWLRGQVLRS